MIYLDNAATSWPKPPEVVRAMVEFMGRAGGNPGRSGHRLSVAAGRIVFDARQAVADLLNVADPLRVILTPNATYALNLALRGLLRHGDRVVCSGVEHNAVMRPLRALEREGVAIAVVPCGPDGSLDPRRLDGAVTPGTRLVVLCHASNVVGTILPIAEAARIAHGAGAFLLVDAAQTAGVVPIDVRALGVDLLAFTGHKGLLGPQGTGGLVIGEGVNVAEITPLVRGGTGSRSEHQEQPEDLPDKYESGTANGPGLAGLAAGIRCIRERGVESIRAWEMAMARGLIDGLSAVPRVRVYGPTDAERRTAVVAFTIGGMRVSEVGQRLEEEFGVLCRVGLHCAPAAHRTIGTFPEGAVRFGLGPFTTDDEIAQAVAAVRRIAEG